MYYFIFKSLILLCLLISSLACSNAQKKENKKVEIDSIKPKKIEIGILEQSLIKHGLVDIQKADNSLLVELKYATTDNFTGKNVYGSLKKAYLQPKATQMLVKANEALKKQYPSYRLLIYDAARPLQAQHVLWQTIGHMPVAERRKYVADPSEGSIHNYGCAVDLTVYDTATKATLDMGTRYDFFGDEAYPTKEQQMLKQGRITQKHINNRLILRKTMMDAGYDKIETEWWHFNALSREDTRKTYKIID